MSTRIMIVDDATFMRMSLRKILEGAFYEVVAEASTGVEAIEKYEKNKPDMVLMDITMPDMDGITAVQEIKKIDRDAKIIMCSAMGQQTKVVDAITAGAKDFIVKPIQEERVLSAIRRWE